MTELTRLTACAAVDLLERRDVSPLDLVEAAAARIAATDGALTALPTLCVDRARDHAKRLMAAPGGSPGTLGRLHGLPIAVKDNVDVGGVRCTSGSLAFEHRIAPANDVVVDRLEAAGALVIGKANLPEFAAGGTTHNEVFGTTYNPWDTTKTCGGSSGGSAAALAAGQVWLATGNDFAGSIRIPSSFCGTVGLRPTAGTVARIQRQAYSPLSVEGPMGRTVADVALMLDCQAGELGADPLSRPAPARTFLSAARAPALPARIAFSTDLGIAPMVDPEVARLCRTTASAMQVPGSRVEEACPDLQDADLVFQVLRSFLYVGRLAHIMDQHRDRMSPNVVWNTEQGLARSTREVVEADVAQAAIARRVVRFFDDHDLLLCPVAISPAFDARQQQLDEFGGVRFGFYYQWMMMTYAITVTACPSLAVPCGLTAGGLPIGMQLIGPPRSEHRLLAAGAWLEQQFGLHARVPLLPQTRKPVSDA
ncbi:MAG: amidase [bacterium]